MESTISNEIFITASSEQMSCDLAGEAVILNFKNGMYYGLDTIGALVWELIQKSKSLKEIREHILESSDVNKEQFENDLRKLLKDLKENGLIEIKNGSLE